MPVSAKKQNVWVIRIDRGDESIINFTSGFVFQEGDVIWLAGEKNKLIA